MAREKPESDVWIEVSEMSEDLAQFYESIAVSVPQYGTSIARLVCKFNLTAYVRHIIEQSKG